MLFTFFLSRIAPHWQAERQPSAFCRGRRGPIGRDPGFCCCWASGRYLGARVKISSYAPTRSVFYVHLFIRLNLTDNSKLLESIFVYGRGWRDLIFDVHFVASLG
jgi:hypothetical protein